MFLIFSRMMFQKLIRTIGVFKNDLTTYFFRQFLMEMTKNESLCCSVINEIVGFFESKNIQRCLKSKLMELFHYCYGNRRSRQKLT